MYYLQIYLFVFCCFFLVMALFSGDRTKEKSPKDQILPKRLKPSFLLDVFQPFLALQQENDLSQNKQRYNAQGTTNNHSFDLKFLL